jgi:quercetin 2,3-dioxygenase
MEILSYVLEGSLAHKDNMGHQETLGPNEIQHMSAGTGVMHSEFNPSGTDPVHFLQIWIEAATRGTPSSYEQLRFDPAEKKGKLKLLAAPQGGAGVARINQDAQVFVTELAKGDKIAYPLGSRRHAWLHVIRGAVTLNGTTLHTGDAAAVTREETLSFAGVNDEPSEVMLFDLA